MKKSDIAEFPFVVILPGLAAMASSACVVLYQAGTWFKTAVWPALTMLDAVSWWKGGPFEFVSTGAFGLDKIMLWYLAQPLAPALFGTAMVYMLVGIWMFDIMMKKYNW